jgi:hypothetical protein
MSAVAERPTNEFHYAPVSPLGPITAFLGLVSTLSLLSLAGIAVGILGVILGLFAILHIRKSNGELRGIWLAVLGLTLSASFAVVGVVLQYHWFSTEVPPDHIRVNFPRDISQLEFVYENKQRKIPPSVEDLLGRKIFIKGWMMPSMRTQGLKTFILIKDSGDCCFGGSPKAFDHIEVTLADGKTTDSYATAMIAVSGVLNANPNVPEGETVYTMQATDCRLAQSTFQGSDLAAID